jgi:hypothetical protein
MPKFKVYTNSNERPSEWWDGKDIETLVQRLPELHAMVADIYETILSRGLNLLSYTVRIEDDKGWVGGGGTRSRDVAFVIEGEQDALASLAKDPVFRGQWLGDDDILDEVLAQIDE